MDNNTYYIGTQYTHFGVVNSAVPVGKHYCFHSGLKNMLRVQFITSPSAVVSHQCANTFMLERP